MLILWWDRLYSIICPDYSPQHIQRPLVFRMHAEERLQCSVKILPHLFLRRDIAPVAARVQVWLAKKQRLQGNYNIYQMRVNSICHWAPAFYVVFYFGIAVRFKDIEEIELYLTEARASSQCNLIPPPASVVPVVPCLWKELCVWTKQAIRQLRQSHCLRPFWVSIESIWFQMCFYMFQYFGVSSQWHSGHNFQLPGKPCQVGERSCQVTVTGSHGIVDDHQLGGLWHLQLSLCQRHFTNILYIIYIHIYIW